MRYAEFREHLEGALRQESLFLDRVGWPVELIELEQSARQWKAHVHPSTPAGAEPFHVFGAIEFDWSPVDAARAFTCEEDLLRELVGRRTRLPRTERRWTRVDLSLRATLPYGSTTTIPGAETFGGWAATMVKNADAAFTHVEERSGRITAVLGGHSGLEIQARCGPDGVVFLNAVAISGFRVVRVPRVWDSPERRAAEADSHREFSRLARTFKTALDDWTGGIRALATWIRYSPPPSGATPIEPWFDNDSDDDDSGPETTH